MLFRFHTHFKNSFLANPAAKFAANGSGNKHENKALILVRLRYHGKMTASTENTHSSRSYWAFDAQFIIYLLKAYNPVNRTWSPQGFFDEQTLQLFTRRSLQNRVKEEESNISNRYVCIASYCTYSWFLFCFLFLEKGVKRVAECRNRA